MARRRAPALPRAASCGPGHWAVRVRNRLGVRFARGSATGEFLPAGVVCDHPLFRPALEQAAALDLAILLLVRASGLLRIIVFHPARAPHPWRNHACAG